MALKVLATLVMVMAGSATAAPVKDLFAPAQTEPARVAPGGVSILPSGRLITPAGRAVQVTHRC